MLLTPDRLEKAMTYLMAQSADIITAASGQDIGLADELRAALAAAALSYVDVLKQPHLFTEDWAQALRRLAGLASSFGAADLHGAVKQALDGPVGNQQAVAQIEAAIAQLQLPDLQIG